jgi:hypothetical protein
MYEPKTPGQLVILKKLEKMLEKMTSLQNEVYANFVFYDLTAKRKLLLEKQVEFGALLLENLQVEAFVGLDKEFVSLLGQLIAKVSPGFDQSPLMAFLELFEEANIELE